MQFFGLTFKGFNSFMFVAMVAHFGGSLFDFFMAHLFKGWSHENERDRIRPPRLVKVALSKQVDNTLAAYR